MGGRFQACIAVSDEPYIHKSASDVVCRDSGQPSGHCCSQAVAMIQKHGTQSKSVHLATDVMSCILEKPKKINCKLLHWAWEGVYNLLELAGFKAESKELPNQGLTIKRLEAQMGHIKAQLQNQVNCISLAL